MMKRRDEDMGPMAALRATLCILLLQVAACSGGTSTPSAISTRGCTAGQANVCACPGDLSGVQICAADGTYGACDCGASDGGGGGASGGDRGGTTGGQQGRSDLGIDPDDGVPPAPTPDAGPTGSGETAEVLIGPEGGTVELGGARLTVPAGTLAEPTTLQITSLASAHTDGYSRYSPVYRFEPAGTHFQVPATVSIEFDGDSTHAALFWSWEGATGYERIGGALANQRIESEVTHFSDGFIADGIEYTDPPDPRCVESRLLEGRSGGAVGIDSAVALFFTVDDCQGRPITGLSEDDFLLLDQDNRELSSEAGKRILQQSGLTVFATLVLDMSESTAPVLPDLIQGAKTFVRALQVDAGLPVHIGIEVFAGDAQSNHWQRHTLDTDLLLTRLDALADYQPSDPRSTNLNGAVQQAYERIGQAEADFRARNRGGAFTAGYVVVFTDGRDTSGPRVDGETVRSQIATSPDALMMVGLAGRDYDLAGLSALEPRYIVTVPLADALAREFGDLARNRIAGQLSRTYLLGYCSTARANEQKVTVTVEGVENRQAAQFTFSADGFTGACRPELFDGLCGQDKPCGGLGCGACDDRTESCQESNRCENNCVVRNECGGQTIQNPAGYEQTCDNAPEHFGCGGQCQDTLNDPNHCGGCDVVCDNRGETCEAGACMLRPGFSRCDTGVVSLDSDRENCGACGHECAGEEICQAGECTCPVAGETSCGGVCLDLDTDSLNCGACGATFPGNGNCVGGRWEAAAEIGGECVQPADCAAGFCMDTEFVRNMYADASTEVPGGYCSSPDCAASSDCLDPGAACVDFEASDIPALGNWCFAKCDAGSGDCRQSQICYCAPPGRPGITDVEGNHGLCLCLPQVIVDRTFAQ